CHAERSTAGATCTAVTLYSGHWVAQSLYSVVTTLAPVSGSWNVVYTTPGGTRSVTFASSVISPLRLVSDTRSPSLMPRSSASDGWISSRSSWYQRTLSVRRGRAATADLVRARAGVSRRWDF